jgi:hypothetical protein
MTADAQLQQLRPQRLRITDLHLEQMSLGMSAADALQGCLKLNNAWDICGTLTSLRFTRHRCYWFDIKVHLVVITPCDPTMMQALLLVMLLLLMAVVVVAAAAWWWWMCVCVVW